MTRQDDRPTIFSTNDIHPAAAAMLSAAGTLVMATRPTGDAILDEAKFADIIIVRAPLPPKLFDAAPRLRAAIRHGAGVDMIPIEEATRAGVLVANVPGVNAVTVAEHVFFASIALLRRFRMVDRDLRHSGWFAGRAHADHGHDLSGRRIGIVGMGNVGRAINRLGQGFGLSVSAATRSPGNLPENVAALDLDQLLETSDIVVLCCPLTPETRGLISRARLARMKPDTLLVNVSRGAVVDEAALIEALQAGRIGGAALDVFVDQPLAADSPLFALDNVVLTPHMAGITEESMQRMGEGAAREALRVLSGELPENLRNPDALPSYRKRFPAA